MLYLGPITNMGLNAREVVRVFACSTQLSFNLSKENYDLMAEPFRKTALSLQSEMDLVKDTLRFVLIMNYRIYWRFLIRSLITHSIAIN